MCCDFLIKSEDGKILVVGRTQEWGSFDLKTDLMYQPALGSFNTKCPLLDKTSIKFPGFDYNNKYGYFYTRSKALKFLDLDVMAMDGINCEGLTCDGLYLPGFSQYSSLTDAKQDSVKKAIYAWNLSSYILGNFADVDEIKKEFSNNDICIYQVSKLLDENVSPIHWQIFDKNGKGIVLEWTKLAGFQIYDSIEVMTNAPPYPWHVENVKQYAHLNATADINVSKQELSVGTGLVGLPGDWTSPSRFVKLYISKKFIDKPKTEKEGEIITKHVLNSCDITKGLACSTSQIFGKEYPHPDYTQYSTVKNITGNKGMHIRSYDNLKWYQFTFEQFKDTKELTVVWTHETDGITENAKRINYKMSKL